jgi:ABC-type transport system substrate-binding protein
MPAPALTRGHAPEVRIGLIGSLGDQNVWALFSGEAYSYNDYAVRAQYWPRLYGLSIPEQDFVPRLASGMPTPIHQESAFHTASVPVHTDMHWTDGSAFSAQDIAFTVNAALQFELGYDWGDFYDGHSLDHAEAVSADTVKFFFKTRPGVEDWQLGALQGPVVQAEYWAPKVAEAAALLPSEETRAKIQALHEKVATLQDEANRLYSETLTAQGAEARELQADLRRQQGNLDEATNDLTEEQAGLQVALQAARFALFEQDDLGEPLLGPWLPDQLPAASADVTNGSNEAYPGALANFDQASYILYRSADAASEALAAGEVNIVLDPSRQSASNSGAQIVSPSRSRRFLVFNVNSAGLQDSALRIALACVLDQADMAARIGNVVELTYVIPAGEPAWHNPEAALPCTGMDASRRLVRATEILRSGGYSWEREPLGDQPGQGLKQPDGSALPALRVLAPNTDEQRAAAAAYVEERAAALGVPLTAQLVAPDALDYAVYSSGDFDAAVLGWRVGAYPGYVCDWFNAGGVFSYSHSALPSVCGELLASSELDDARGHVYAMQEALVDEMPIIPLYSAAVTDNLQGVGYPFASVMDGLAGVHGALDLAFSTAP